MVYDVADEKVLRLVQVVGTLRFSHDNGTITSVTVNGEAAVRSPQVAGVVDWRVELSAAPTSVIAIAIDEAGNVEQTGHRLTVGAPLAKK